MSVKMQLSKYNNLGAPVKATIWFTFCSFLQKGISMITTPLFTRLLTTEQYGVYSVYQSWYSILSIVLTLSIASGVFNNGMVKYADHREEYISSIQGLIIVSTSVFLAIYLLAKDLWNSLLGLSTFFVSLIFLQCFFEASFAFWSARQRFEFKYKLLVIITIIISVMSPLLGGIAVISSQYKAEARIVSFVFVQVLVGAAFFIYNYIKGKTLYKKEYWLYTLSLAIPLIPHYLSMTLLQQSDRIMISQMAGTGKAAIYSVAYSISTLMMLLTNAINASFVPYTYQYLKKKEYSGIRNSSNFLIVLVGGVSLLVMCLGPEAIKIFATTDYYEAIWIMPPIAASVYFRFLYPLYSNVEFYYERKWYVMWASVCGAIVNIILNYICIKAFGYIAAGYTTLVCYILFTVFHYVFHSKIIKEEIPEIKSIYDIRFHFRFSLFILVCMIIVTFTYYLTILRYTLILCIMIIILLKRKTIIAQIKHIRNK